MQSMADDKTQDIGNDSDDLTPEEQAMLDSSKDDEVVVLDETDEMDEANAQAEEAVKKVAAKRKSRAKAAKNKEGTEVEEADAKADAEGDQGDQGDAEDAAKDDGMVPIQAVDRERHKRNAAESELAQLRQLAMQQQNALQQLQQIQQQGLAQQQQPQAQQAAPTERPDPVTDPDGFFAYIEAENAKARAPYEEMQRQQQQQQHSIAALSDLKAYAGQDEAHFRAVHTDKNYDEALEYARDIKRREFKLMGLRDDVIASFIPQVEAGVAQMARVYGISAANYIWNYAKMHGYGSQEQQEQQVDESQNVTRLASVQRQTQSGAGRSGAPRDDVMSIERLANMSEAEIAKLDPDVLREAMGG